MDYHVCTRFPQSDVDDMDALVDSNKYMNRSDAVRDLVRKGLASLKAERRLA